MDLTNISLYYDNCTYPLSTLGFLTHLNMSDPKVAQLTWPCEIRSYWIQINPFVSTVKFLLTYVTTIIIFIGIAMNTLSFLILKSSPICHTSLSVFLRALAVSDNGALIFNFATGVGRSHVPIFSKLYLENGWLCGANKVLIDVFLFYSTWLVVGLTMKRLLVIGCPMRFGVKCNVKRAKKIVYCIGLMSLSIACLKLKYAGYEQDSTFGFKPCKFHSENSDKVVYVYIALQTWLPCLMIFVGNILLIRQVRLTNKSRFELMLGAIPADRAMVKRFNETHRMLGLLLAVSFTSLVLMLPLGIVETFELYWDVVLIKRPSTQTLAKQQYIKWQQEKILLKWVRGLFFSFYQWNFSINFFLYCLTGRKFRNAAKIYFQNSRFSFCWNCNFITRIRRQLSRLTRSQDTQSTDIEMEAQGKDLTVKEKQNGEIELQGKDLNVEQRQKEKIKMQGKDLKVKEERQNGDIEVGGRNLKVEEMEKREIGVREKDLKVEEKENREIELQGKDLKVEEIENREIELRGKDLKIEEKRNGEMEEIKAKVVDNLKP